MRSIKDRHLKKFNKINDRFNDDAQTGIDKSKWIVNLSNRQLTTEETNLLSKGMNFCMTPASLPKKEIVAKVEEAIKDLPKEEADTVRSKVSLTLQKSKTPKDNLQKSERLSLKNLKKDKDIIILPADKGRTMVIMITPDYIDKKIADDECMEEVTVHSLKNGSQKHYFSNKSDG
ncbi:uncharacterized protein LOC130613523 [Hydractinia symbiolongicarpus]|uniref:uncharacterized protein LOC130613523 n=1 Tax=Hydractinia symbiolongicarpus TaxID=13093 RepID=UPI00254C6F0F|nr:uncharacterized protein LOC130613523 [Hydractinia symbiolongicarpus]